MKNDVTSSPRRSRCFPDVECVSVAYDLQLLNEFEQRKKRISDLERRVAEMDASLSAHKTNMDNMKAK